MTIESIKDCENDPLRYVDPTGHEPKFVIFNLDGEISSVAPKDLATKVSQGWIVDKPEAYKKGDEMLPPAISYTLNDLRQQEAKEKNMTEKIKLAIQATKIRINYVYNDNKATTIEGYFFSLGINTSEANLKKLAQVTGIKDYKGTDAQDDNWLKSLKNSKAELAKKLDVDGYKNNDDKNTDLAEALWGTQNIKWSAALKKKAAPFISATLYEKIKKNHYSFKAPQNNEFVDELLKANWWSPGDILLSMLTNTINDAKIAFTGVDLRGTFADESQIKDAKFWTILSLGGLFMGAAESRVIKSVPVDELSDFVKGAGSAVAKSGGRLGNASTQAQNKQIADYLESEGWKITGGGGRMKEEYLPGPNGGTKGSNYVDITATKNGQTIRINTVDTYKSGTLTKRESNAAKSIDAKTGGNIITIPKGAGLGNLPNKLK